jgi:hypothetical protein
LEGKEKAMIVYKAGRSLVMLLMFAVLCMLAGFAVMYLWNWLMPALFGLKTITYWQGFGLLALCKILFGGFHRHGNRGERSALRHKWKREMKQRLESMSPEERERFRAGMRNKCGWGRRRGGMDGSREEAAQQERR